MRVRTPPTIHLETGLLPPVTLRIHKNVLWRLMVLRRLPSGPRLIATFLRVKVALPSASAPFLTVPEPHAKLTTNLLVNSLILLGARGCTSDSPLPPSLTSVRKVEWPTSSLTGPAVPVGTTQSPFPWTMLLTPFLVYKISIW